MTEREHLEQLYSDTVEGPTYTRRALSYCYNPLLDYGARQAQRLELETQPAECGGNPEAAKTARRKFEAAAQVVADFFFDGDIAEARATIQAQAAFRDLETQTADALTLCAPPIRNGGEVVTW